MPPFFTKGGKMDSFILDDFTWSFSRLESFERCPKSFQFQYEKENEGIDGAFGQFGDVVHYCLEKYAKGELGEYELVDTYSEQFVQQVINQFPPSRVDLRESYYKQGLAYFESFTGFGDRKITGVENEYLFKVDKYKFTGKIDLETENEIIDHKTKREQHLKRLNKNHKKEEYITMLDGRFIHYSNFIQLYTYSIPYREKYGHYPERLHLNMARIHDWYTVEFNEKFFKMSQEWLLNQINLIYKTVEFVKGDSVDSFWCDYTCSHRFDCPYSNKFFG